MDNMAETLKLKKVEISECDNLFKWRNHPDVRKHSFNTKVISWQEHKEWFYSKIKDPNTKIYVATLGKDKIGVIRFEIEDDSAKVSVNLNPDFLGKGLGSKIIKLGTKKFLQEAKVRKGIAAEIKEDNIASKKVFSKAGYVIEKEMKGKSIYVKR